MFAYDGIGLVERAEDTGFLIVEDPAIPTLRRFRVAAIAYLDWCLYGRVDGVVGVRTAIEALANLLGAVQPLHALSRIESVHEDRLDLDSIVPVVDSERLYVRFTGLPVGFYRVVADPAKIGDQDLLVGDVADDLRDIAMDLLEGFREWQAGSAADAVENWLDLYRVHWGLHAANALAALTHWSRANG